jgi:hypothetical protein
MVCLLLLSRPLHAESRGRVVVVSVNRTSLAQAAADPAMAIWLGRGSVALFNIITAARATPEHVYVTMGAASRAVAGNNARLAFNRDEEYTGLEAATVYVRHMATEPAGEILHLGMAEIKRLNLGLPYTVQPGLLGDALRESGKVTAVLGNTDGAGPGREAVLFLADGSGTVSAGEVSRAILQRNNWYPFGWKTDREKMWAKFQELYSEADVLLVDWGDFARLDEYRPLLAEKTVQKLEQEIFGDVSWFLTRVFAMMSPEDLLLIISPVPRAGESGGHLFGYMAALGGPYMPGSLLSSATTRRPGLTAATDIAPMVLDHLGVAAPGAMLGRTITVSVAGGVSELLRMQKETDRIFRLRPPLLKTYVFFQIIIVLGALLNLFLRLVPFRWFEPLLLGLLTVPLLLLLMPLQQVSLVAGFVLTFAAALVLVLILRRVLREHIAQFAAVAVPTALLLIADLLRDAPLIKASVLGYDPVSGARYYGLGNEYMGVLVGTTVLGVATLLTLAPRYRRLLLPAAAVLFFAVLLLMVSPTGGANFGGTVTAFVAFLVTLAVVGNIRPGWKSSALALSMLLVIGVLALFVNLRVPQDAQSHLGRTVELLRQDGWQALQNVISRKAAMNVRLFRYSQWSRAFLAFLLVFSVLFYRPRGILRDLHKIYPNLAAGFLGIIAGSATAFLMNDSGVVAAATTLLYAGVPVIMLCGRSVEEMVRTNHKDK